MILIGKAQDVKKITLLIAAQRQLMEFLAEDTPDFFRVDTAIEIIDSVIREYKTEVLQNENRTPVHVPAVRHSNCH
jgi:hypothetical protein